MTDPKQGPGTWGVEMAALFFLEEAWSLSSREAILQVCSSRKIICSLVCVGEVFIKEKKGCFFLYTQFTAVYQSWLVSNEFEFTNSQMRIILGILWSCSEKQQGSITCSARSASLLSEADACFCIQTHFREETHQWFSKVVEGFF